jgi:hypothetical protein
MRPRESAPRTAFVSAEGATTTACYKDAVLRRAPKLAGAGLGHARPSANVRGAAAAGAAEEALAATGKTATAVISAPAADDNLERLAGLHVERGRSPAAQTATGDKQPGSGRVAALRTEQVERDSRNARRDGPRVNTRRAEGCERTSCIGGARCTNRKQGSRRNGYDAAPHASEPVSRHSLPPK